MEQWIPQETSYDHDLGVLLVHGIGQQVKGETLVRFGDPIQRWLERWMSGRATPDADRHARVTVAKFLPASGDSDAPAHAEMHIRTDANSDAPPARWLVAEAWWADGFLPPTYRELAVWGLRILPWTLSTHFATRARRVVHDLKAARGLRRVVVGSRLALEACGFFLAVLAFPILVTLLALVLIVGLLPIPSVRAFAARMQRVLSGTIGDSYVLVASPIQEAVIAGRVARDLEWLLGRCRKVAVVAHSQGAAIAHAVMRGRAAEPDDDAGRLVFVTFGSGLNKLAEIRRLHNAVHPISVWLAPVGLLLLAAALPEVYATFADDDNVFALYAALLGLLLFALGVAAAWKENRLPVSELAIARGTRWLDFHASADPVPNGPLFDAPETNEQLMQVRRVHNLASPLVDHVTYWRSDDDFTAHVACALADHAGLALRKEASSDDSHLFVAPARRRWRVRWLLFARLVLAVLTIGVGVHFWRDLPAATHAGLQAITPVISWIPLVGDVVKPLREITFASELVGAAVLFLFGILAYYVLYLAWTSWNRRDTADFFARSSWTVFSDSFLGFLLVFVLLVGAFAVAIAGYGDGIPAGLVAAIITWAAVVVFISFLVVVVSGVFGQVWNIVRVVARLVRRLGKLLARTTATPGTAPASPNSQESASPLIEWRRIEAGHRVAYAFFALVALSFPYMAIIASSVDSAKLWATGWGWRLRIIDVLEQQSRGYVIALWQWLLGALLLVVLANAISLIADLTRARRWLNRISHTGPVVLAHADLLQPNEAADLLRRRVALLGPEHDDLVSAFTRLRKAEAQSKDAQAKIELPTRDGRSFTLVSGSYHEQSLAIDLRELGNEACEIALRLPADDRETEELLRRVATSSPRAALMLARRIDRSDPAGAAALLEGHMKQRSWLLRRRLKRALAELGTIRAPQAVS